MTTSDQLRILIVFAVLRSKPLDQTLFSHIQTLKAVFPLTKPQPPSNANAIPIVASIHEHAWKAHAQRLEAECTALKDRVADLETRNLVHSTLEDETRAVLNSQNTTAKKKSKKNAQLVAQGVTPTGTELTASAHNHTSNTLLFALSKFSQLSQSPSTSISPTTLLAITQKLFTGLSEAIQLATTHTNRKTFAKVHTDLYAVLSSVFVVSAQMQVNTTNHYENTNSNLDIFKAQQTIAPILDQLLTSFLIPLTSQFLSSSTTLLTNALDPPTPSQALKHPASQAQAPSQKPSQAAAAAPSSPPFDPRPSLLALFQAAITLTHTSLSVSFPKEAQTETNTGRSERIPTSTDDLTIFLHTLILELVRQVYGMLKLPAAAAASGPAYITPQPGITSLPTSKPKLSRQQRVRGLAVKDTFWYLSSAIHFTLDFLDSICLPQVASGCRADSSYPTTNPTDPTDPKATHNPDPKRTDPPSSHLLSTSSSKATTQTRLSLLHTTTLTDLTALLLYQDRTRAAAYASYMRSGVPGSAGSGVVKDGSGGVRDGGTSTNDATRTTTTTTTRKSQSQIHAHAHTSSGALSNLTGESPLSESMRSAHPTATQSKDKVKQTDKENEAPSSGPHVPPASPAKVPVANDKFYTLDDIEYRMFLRLVERLGCLDVP